MAGRRFDLSVALRHTVGFDQLDVIVERNFALNVKKVNTHPKI